MIQSMIDMKTLIFQSDSPIGILAYYEPRHASNLIVNCTEHFLV